MLIQATAYTRNVGYESHLVAKYGADTAAFQAAAETVDRVTLSDAGRAMNDAVSKVVDPSGERWALTSATGELKSVPLLGYDEARGLAEAGLKEAMRQLGIPAGTKISLSVNNDGTISVQGGGEHNAALEALVNENGDLRNVLVAAQSAAYMARIGAAHEQVVAAVANDPDSAERAYAWLIDVSRRISAMDFQFDFADGELTGSFLSGGQKLGLTENMETFRA